MEKDLIFFAKGDEKVQLTSTSANYLANIAKESYMQLEGFISRVKFIQTDVKTLSGTTAYIISKGSSNEDLLCIEGILQRIALLKSFIAWLREAIKARTALTKEVQNTSNEEWAELLGIEFPQCPVAEHILTEDEYLASLNIKERNRYYELETLCAVYGKAVHVEGTITKARTEYKNALIKPVTIEGMGRDCTIYEYTPTVTQNVVEDTYFHLQDSYRSYQAELNGMKHSMEMTIQKSLEDVNAKFTSDMSEYRARMAEFNAQKQEMETKKLDEIRALKIIIPDKFVSLYDELTKLGKESK